MGRSHDGKILVAGVVEWSRAVRLDAFVEAGRGLFGGDAQELRGDEHRRRNDSSDRRPVVLQRHESAQAQNAISSLAQVLVRTTGQERRWDGPGVAQAASAAVSCARRSRAEPRLISDRHPRSGCENPALRANGAEPLRISASVAVRHFRWTVQSSPYSGRTMECTSSMSRKDAAVSTSFTIARKSSSSA